MNSTPVGDASGPIRRWLEGHLDDMTADLAELVSRESPSSDAALKRDFVAWLLPWIAERVADTQGPLVEPTDANGHTAVIRVGESAAAADTVVALSHFDTVWERGTIDHRPVTCRDGRMTGPGVFDMKAGIVHLIWAIRAAQHCGLPLPPLLLLFSGDEEIGSNGSRPIIEEVCRGALAALVFEPSYHGALKTSRKGTGSFDVEFTGIPAHPGLDPGKGASAIQAAAECINFFYSLQDRDRGTQVSVGVVRGGTRRNVVAASALLEVDIRVAQQSEAERLDQALRDWAPSDERVSVRSTGGWSRPVMERTAGTVSLFERAKAIGIDLGIDLTEISVGGASDGNFAAALGVPVLDGLGAVGDGAHATTEWVSLADMPVRASLAALLMADIRRRRSR